MAQPIVWPSLEELITLIEEHQLYAAWQLAKLLKCNETTVTKHYRSRHGISYARVVADLIKAGRLPPRDWSASRRTKPIVTPLVKCSVAHGSIMDDPPPHLLSRLACLPECERHHVCPSYRDAMIRTGDWA